jgi:hypothetical protein
MQTQVDIVLVAQQAPGQERIATDDAADVVPVLSHTVDGI